MNYEMARWLLNLCSERYSSTRHMALQVEAASFIANYDLEKWDADGLRDALASFQLKLRIMEIRRRLSDPVYEDDHIALRQELDGAIADAQQLIINTTEDPRGRKNKTHMSKDLESADKHQFQLIIEKLEALVAQFEAYFSCVESLKERCGAAEAEALDTLNIKGLSQNQILQAVAKKRLEQYPSQREAAESLGIDIRTLKKYAAYNETDDE